MENRIDDYFKMFISSIKIQCLAEALKLNIFDLLYADKGMDEIVRNLNLDKNNLKILLDGLVFMGLLKHKNNTYELTKISNEYFLSKSPMYVGDMYLQRYVMTKNGNKLIEKFLQNTKVKMPQNKEKIWAMASSKSIKQEQALRKEFVTNMLLGLKIFPKSGKILDLGCSSGLMILDTIKDYPNLELVLFDYNEVIKTTKENIKNCNFKDRVSTISGDINKDDIGENYDLIWCSHVIYFLDKKEEILKKIYKALKPNGIFVSYHSEIDTNDIKYKDNFFYFLYLAMQNRQLLKPLELVYALEDMDFKSIVSFENPNDLVSSSQITIARKSDE